MHTAAIPGAAKIQWNLLDPDLYLKKLVRIQVQAPSKISMNWLYIFVVKYMRILLQKEKYNQAPFFADF